MNEVFFRKIKKSDIKEVSILLNQLKKIDLSKINYKNSWDRGYVFINKNKNNHEQYNVVDMNKYYEFFKSKKYKRYITRKKETEIIL